MIDGDRVRLGALGARGAQDEGVVGGEGEPRFGQGPHADLGPLKIREDGDGTLAVPGDAPDQRDRVGVGLVRPVGEVNPHRVEPGVHEAFEGLAIRRGGPEGAQDLAAAAVHVLG